jgi:hypothetical protein
MTNINTGIVDAVLNDLDDEPEPSREMRRRLKLRTRAERACDQGVPMVAR